MSTRQSIERRGSDDSGRTTAPVLAAGGIASTALSVLGSVIAYGVLPGTVRIHWRFGSGPFYGPEHAPTAVVLVAFPVMVAGLALGAQRLATSLRDHDAFDRIAPYDTLVALSVLAALLLVQAALIVANL